MVHDQVFYEFIKTDDKLATLIGKHSGEHIKSLCIYNTWPPDEEMILQQPLMAKARLLVTEGYSYFEMIGAYKWVSFPFHFIFHQSL